MLRKKHRMINIGKKFENNFRNSIPNDVLYYRLKDSAQSFGKTCNLRFSLKNPCDCFIYSFPIFMALELKSVGTTSISFERKKDDKGVIHYHQIQDLQKFAKYKNVVAGFLFNFRHKNNTETCYFQHINDFSTMIDNISKKSFNEKDLSCYNPLIIENKKQKVNYKYSVNKFISDIKDKYYIE